MNKRLSIVLVVIAIVVAAGGLFVYLGSSDDNRADTDNTSSENNDQKTASENATASPQDSEAQTPSNSNQTTTPATKAVTIDDMAFSPKEITVKVGTTVTWTNQDTVSHDVKDDDGSADGPSSELLGQGESYSFTFKKAGTYNYHCTPHPFMKATVIVTE